MRRVSVTEPTERQDEKIDRRFLRLCSCVQKTLAQVERRVFTNDQVIEQQRRVVDGVDRSAHLESAKTSSHSGEQVGTS